MKKHAYLIMAHNDFSLLLNLLSNIDDDRNDIFLHIDKKAKHVPFKLLKDNVKKSNIYFVDRMSVRWGAFSQIECELNLLKKAKEIDNYAYYHLLSGSDLPLKTQDEIREFYNKHQGKEFLQFVDETVIKSKNCYERLRFYSFFQGYSKHKSILIRGGFQLFNAVSIHLQMLLRIDRIKQMQEKLAFGANWFSITDDLVMYILTKESWIRKHFKHSRCADEMFLQMIVYNSSFFEKVYHKILEDNFDGYPICRAIDWQRGNPYVYQKQDFDQLKNSDCLFARKFNSQIDNDIIQEVCMYLRSK